MRDTRQKLVSELALEGWNGIVVHTTNYRRRGELPSSYSCLTKLPGAPKYRLPGRQRHAEIRTVSHGTTSPTVGTRITLVHATVSAANHHTAEDPAKQPADTAAAVG